MFLGFVEGVLEGRVHDDIVPILMRSLFGKFPIIRENLIAEGADGKFVLLGERGREKSRIEVEPLRVLSDLAFVVHERCRLVDFHHV